MGEERERGTDTETAPHGEMPGQPSGEAAESRPCEPPTLTGAGGQGPSGAHNPAKLGASPGPATNTLAAFLTFLTAERFARIMDRIPTSRQAAHYEATLNACLLYRLTNPEHLAAALAQWSHETGGGRYMSELWGPTAQQQRYEPPSALAAKLGNTQPGDGERFLGRGYPMLTGRANYRDAALEFSLPLERDPWRVSELPLAALVGAWFFCRHNLTGLDFEAQTRRLNGGLTGMPDRLQRWVKARQVLGLA